jgi:hypothetical protein
MATVTDVTPCESRRLIPNRGRFTPFIDLGRGPGGWYWRLRLTHLDTDVAVRWRGAFESRDEALSAGIVNFNTICAIKDGTLAQPYQATLDPILEALRESAERK